MSRIVLLLLGVTLAAAYNCTFRDLHTHALWNLNRLERWHDDYIGQGAGASPYYYTMNVCGPSRRRDHCEDMGYGLCRYQKSDNKFVDNMGWWAGESPHWELMTPGQPQVGIKATFQNGDQCNNGGHLQHKRVTVLFACAAGEAAPTFEVTDDWANCQFTFTLKSKHGCPIHRPQMPHPPRDFMASMEVTNSYHNETYWIHEIRDERRQRVRHDSQNHPGGHLTVLFEYDNHFRYNVWNFTKCTRLPLSPTLFMPPSVFDLFREHMHQLQYYGQTVIHGVLSDVYEGHWVWHHPQDAQWYREDAVWFFAADHWNVVEDPFLRRRPVLAMLQSNRSLPHFTGHEQHSFTFMDLREHINGWMRRELRLQPEWNCPDGPVLPVFPPITNFGISSATLGGFSLFGLCLGGGLGLFAHWYWQRRKNGGSGGFATQTSTYDGEGAQITGFTA